jgi:hypothetical protein
MIRPCHRLLPRRAFNFVQLSFSSSQSPPETKKPGENRMIRNERWKELNAVRKNEDKMKDILNALSNAPSKAANIQSNITPGENIVNATLDATSTAPITPVNMQPDVAQGRKRSTLSSTSEFLAALKQSLASEDAGAFEDTMKTYSFQMRTAGSAKVSSETKREIMTLVREWNQLTGMYHSRADILRSLCGLQFSVQNPLEKDLVEELIYGYLKKQDAAVVGLSLSKFLTALRFLQYEWRLLNAQRKQQIISVFEHIHKNTNCDSRELSEIITALGGIGFNWNELTDKGKESYFQRLTDIKEDFTGLDAVILIFNFGKLNVRIRRNVSRETEQTFIFLVQKAIDGIQKGMKGTDREKNVRKFF